MIVRHACQCILTNELAMPLNLQSLVAMDFPPTEVSRSQHRVERRTLLLHLYQWHIRKKLQPVITTNLVGRKLVFALASMWQTTYQDTFIRYILNTQAKTAESGSYRIGRLKPPDRYGTATNG
jgi:hypothetical protein